MKSLFATVAKKIALAFSGVILTLGLVACDEKNAPQSSAKVSIEAVSTNSKKEELELRVKERWNALVKKDIDGAYEYTSPAYRKLHTLESYKSLFGNAVAWNSVKIISIEVDDVSAKVKVEVNYPMPFANNTPLNAQDSELISKELNESWVWSENQWWYVQQNSSF